MDVCLETLVDRRQSDFARGNERTPNSIVFTATAPTHVLAQDCDRFGKAKERVGVKEGVGQWVAIQLLILEFGTPFAGSAVEKTSPSETSPTESRRSLPNVVPG